MFKKFISMATSAFLMALSLSAITAGPASAADISSFVVGCSQGPLPGQSTSGVNCANPGIDPEWTLSSPTWSPTVSSTFAANTVYSVTYTLTPAMRQSGRLTIPTLSANVFSVNTSYAGSPSGTTVTSLASTSGDSTMTITITFPSTGSIGGGGGGSADADGWDVYDAERDESDVDWSECCGDGGDAEPELGHECDHGDADDGGQ